VRKTNPTPANPERPTAPAAARGRAVVLVICAAVAMAAAGWAILTRLGGLAAKPELLTYRLCVAPEQKPCPSDTAFVKNTGEDTVAKWAQRECAGYKSRRIIINDGPSQDCGCFLADVSCSSE
jgi:hypothetical protein